MNSKYVFSHHSVVVGADKSVQNTLVATIRALVYSRIYFFLSTIACNPKSVEGLYIGEN